MSTYYVDFVNGNDSNAGTSWGTAWKTFTNGPTAARVSAGDIVRVAKSPDPVSLGINATWPAQVKLATNNKSISSSTNASPIEVTTSADHGYSTGDVVHITQHNTNFTANGLWTVTVTATNKFTLDGSTGIGVGSSGQSYLVNKWVVKLASALTKTITRCEQTWVSDNSSTTTSASGYSKEGWYASYVSKTSPASTTLYAHQAIGGGSGVNFSSYQSISFWIYLQASLPVGSIKLCLCSDTAGASIVDTFTFPLIGAGYLQPVTIVKDGGGNLGSSIQSIALYSTASPNSFTVYLDNIVACTSSGISFTSLISKNSSAQGGTDPWLGISMISEDGKLYYLDQGPSTASGTAMNNSCVGGYGGGAGTSTLYKREPIQVNPLSYTNVITVTGSVGNNIQFQGGYNTSNSSQDGETFYYGGLGYGQGILINNSSYVTFNWFSCSRYSTGIQVASSNNITIGTISNVNNNDYYGFMFNSSTAGDTLTVDAITNACNTPQYGIWCTAPSTSEANITTLTNLWSNYMYGIYATNTNITTISKAVGNNYGAYLGTNCYVHEITSTDYNYQGVAFNVAYGSIRPKIDTITSACYNTNTGVQSYHADITTITNANYNTQNGVYVYGAGVSRIQTITNANNNGTYGVYIYISGSGGTASRIDRVSHADNNGQYGVAISASPGSYVGYASVSGNGFGGITLAQGYGRIGESAGTDSFTCNSGWNRNDFISVERYGGVDGRWKRCSQYGTISDQITGGQTEAWSYGGSGTCLYMNPSSTVEGLYTNFYIPVTGGSAHVVKFFVKKTSSGATCTLTVFIDGCGSTLIMDENVVLTDNWAEYTSTSFTPAYSGFMYVELCALDGTSTGDIGIDNVRVAPGI